MVSAERQTASGEVRPPIGSGDEWALLPHGRHEGAAAMQSRPYKADRAKTGYALSKQASAMDTGGPLLAAARTALGAWPEANTCIARAARPAKPLHRNGSGRAVTVC